MAATVTGGVSGTIQTTRTLDTGIFAGQQQTFSDTSKAQYQPGTAADLIDTRFVKRLTFTASTAQTLDLSNLTGDDYAACNFARVRALWIRVNSTTDAATLTIDNAGATNPFTGFVSATGQLTIHASTADANAANGLKNQGFVILTAPNTTGAAVGTGINLRLLPSAHAFTADVVILGCSA